VLHFRPDTLPAVAMALLLMGCTTSGRSGPTAPIPAPLTCPASLAAEIGPEPLPPPGLRPEDLPPELSLFIWGQWLPWARGNTKRLDQARAWCKEKVG